MRFACAFSKMRNEDREEKALQIGEAGEAGPKISSAVAMVAQEKHNFIRRI